MVKCCLNKFKENGVESSDFVTFLKKLDEKYQKGDIIRIILDNHFAHTSKEPKEYLNTVSGRFEFVFSLAEETALVWRGTEIELSDLAVNDMVSITFAGEIQETYPARIMNVIKVQLLGENLD
ncbi:hypothetical protein [Falcatimonas sp. MSJ-15]|uniref:hypothetical protein n=1 Tax=Falcatimonas sp. MSJ-15 TaxID=2841515 RepID=UPI003530242F